MEVADPVVKSALLIAPTYDHLSEKCRLQGTINDVEMMKGIISEPPFNFQYIKELTHASATYNNILESVAQICTEAPPNSVVLIYYSGHGCRVPGQEEGNYDEGLVPSDANQENLCITGEALTEHLQRLAEKNVATTVVFDCCYSGHMYRGASAGCDKSNFKITAVKQVDFGGKNPVQNEVDEPSALSNLVKESWTAKRRTGGWRPTDYDKFVYLSSCNSHERAFEGRFGQGKHCGLFTQILVNILKVVAKEDKEISYEVLFSLIREKFLQDNIEFQSPISNIKTQTPQLEGGEFGTVLFDVKKVKLRTNLIEISKVENKEVELRAGRLQLMDDGEYDVFKADVTEDGLNNRSEYWLGNVDVNQGDIGISTSRGSVIREQKEPGAIKPGCLARLAKRGSMRRYNVVLGSHDTAEKMKSKIEETNMFNIREQKERDDDYVLTIELIKGKECWCARRGGAITLPPVYLEEEDIMAKNMAKDARYRMTSKLELSDSRELQKISLKIVKIEKVRKEAFRNQFLKKEVMAIALDNQNDLYEDGALQDHLPTFRAHEAYITEISGNKTTQLVDMSGDALVIRVTNKEKSTIHICIMFLQLDGSIVSLYPKKKGRTIELKPGESAEEIVRMYIPAFALRLHCEPDLNKPEPDEAVDTIMLLAATEPCDFGPLLQSKIDFGGPMREFRAEEKGRCENLYPLEKFQMALCNRNGDSLDGFASHQWLVMKRSFTLKN